MTAADPMGERVTIAVLGERLGTAIKMIEDQNKALKELAAEVRDWNRCQGELTQRVTAIETMQGTHSDEIKGLRARDQNGNIITGFMAVVAGLLGIFFKP